MRKVADAERIKAFMRALGGAAETQASVYFTGGATAVLMGWRPSTIDIDLHVVPESDALYRAIPRLKDELQVNVELASPADFIPEMAGWETRSPFIARERKVSFYHYDPYAQTLSKIERRHAQDVEDVRQFIRSGLVDPARAMRYFGEIEPQLYRYPAIDPASFRKAAEEMLQPAGL
jgi:hypothetical protein